MNKVNLVMVIVVFVLTLVLATNIVCAQPEYRIDAVLVEHEAQQAREWVFKDYVESTSGGKIEVELYARGAIAPGGMGDQMEMCMAGELQYTALSEGQISNFFPEVEIFTLPFLISDWQVADRICRHDSAIFNWVKEGIYEGSGGKLRLVGMNINSLRQLYSVDPIRTPQDVKDYNVKIRVKEVPMVVETWRALGANVIALPPADMYMALETGMVNTLEGSLNTMVGIGAFDILDYISLINYQCALNYVVVNEEFYQSLPEDLRTIVNRGFQRASWIDTPYRTYSEMRLFGEVMKEGGSVEEIISLTDNEVKQWQDIAIPAATKYLLEDTGIDQASVDFVIKEVRKAEENIAREADAVEF